MQNLIKSKMKSCIAENNITSGKTLKESASKQESINNKNTPEANTTLFVNTYLLFPVSIFLKCK